jgi:serine/threonine-protein kinase
MTGVRAQEQLDHYQLEHLVARSGMASIFRATDMRTGREVAIKLPHPHIEADPALYDRFQREGEIGQRLDHPGVMKVYGDPDRTRVYMVMEWLNGRLLRNTLHDSQKFTQDRAVRITVSICGVLDYIHQNGVTHRDLKPENIMLDDQDRPKLIDFGIAGVAGARRLTFGKFSQLMGTPEYIAPEQVKGKRGDGRSDIYALGVMLYEMLSGKTPFEGPTALAVMNSRVVNSPIPPREAIPEISLQLQEVIYRALERDPQKRYSTAAEFAWDLTHLDQIEPRDRPELRDWKKPPTPWLRKSLFYAMLVSIPLVIFSAIFWVLSITKR